MLRSVEYKHFLFTDHTNFNTDFLHFTREVIVTLHHGHGVPSSFRARYDPQGEHVALRKRKLRDEVEACLIERQN
jgi:hypothetical protein